MLVIRMQRTGRKGHAQFRVVVQDSRRTPTSGKVVASLGHFNPHTKETSLDKEKASFYLEHGAQPSERVVRLLKQEGVKMPAWVSLAADKSRTIRHGDKLRKNRPAEEAAPATEVSEEAPVEPEVTAEAVAEEDAPAEDKTDEPAVAAAEPAEAAKKDVPAEEPETTEVEAEKPAK